jgi:hypothetical protein
MHVVKLSNYNIDYIVVLMNITRQFYYLHFKVLLTISSAYKMNEMGGACSSDGEGRSMYRVLVGKPEGKRPLGRPRCRWEYNIKMNIQEVGRGVWTGLGWLRIETGGGHS